MSESASNGTEGRVAAEERQLGENANVQYSNYKSEVEAIAERDADFEGLEGRQKMEELEKKISELEAQSDENKDKYLRALAELENLKKRSIKDRAELLKYQGDRIFTDLLQVVDNLELALKHADADPATLKDGVQLIYKLFLDTLNKWEVRGDSALGKEFDPNRHSALSRVPTTDCAPGTIIQEFRKAYFYKDKLLRPAEVIVAADMGISEPNEDQVQDGNMEIASDEKEKVEKATVEKGGQ